MDGYIFVSKKETNSKLKDKNKSSQHSQNSNIWRSYSLFNEITLVENES